MSDVYQGPEGAAHSKYEKTLRRIASALGKDENTFLDQNAAETDLADICELLQILHALENSADRRKVLAFARAIAATRSDRPDR